ncbi:hypothetical protein KI387_008741, partial [Taxus chinensis]
RASSHPILPVEGQLVPQLQPGYGTTIPKFSSYPRPQPPGVAPRAYPTLHPYAAQPSYGAHPLYGHTFTAQPGGFAFVTFKTAEAANKALEDTNRNLDGRAVTVKLAIEGQKERAASQPTRPVQ